MIEQEESNVKFTQVMRNGTGFGVLAVFVLAVFTVAVIGGIIATQSF